MSNLTTQVYRRWREIALALSECRYGFTVAPWFVACQLAWRPTPADQYQLTDRGRRFLEVGPHAINARLPVGWDAWEEMVNAKTRRGRRKNKPAAPVDGRS